MSRILFFDLETSGLSKDNAEILNFAAIVYNEETQTIENEYCNFVKPKTPIPYMITKLTGITNKQVENCFGEGIVFLEFMDWVKKQGCDMVAGHNIKKFDIPWIQSKSKKYFVDYCLPTNIIDTLDLAKQAYKDGLLPDYNYTTDKGNLSFKQEYLMDYYKLGTQEHLAITDVQFDIMIYQRIKDAMNDMDYGF